MTDGTTDRIIALYPAKRRLLRGLNLYRLLFPAPVVLVNDEGIVWQPPAWLFLKWRMEITWPEIAAMYIHEVTAQVTPALQAHRLRRTSPIHRYLAIIPKDPEAFGQRHKLTHLRNFPLWPLIAATRAPLLILEPHIAPVSLEGLLTQIRTRFQAELEVNGIEVRELQRTTSAEFLQRGPRRAIEDLALDRDSFRQWLEQQEGPLVGTGRTSPLGGVGGGQGTAPEVVDDTPLARYLAGILGYQVVIGSPLVFPLHAENQPMRRLPPWARAFDEQVQPTPEKIVTKAEALAVLEQV